MCSVNHDACNVLVYSVQASDHHISEIEKFGIVRSNFRELDTEN